MMTVTLVDPSYVGTYVSPNPGTSLDKLIQTEVTDQMELNTATNERTTLVAIWAKKAALQAVYERTDDLPGYHAYVVGARGAWGIGKTHEEARQDLEEVLVDWARLKLDIGQHDIPAFGGLDLIPDR